MSGNFYSVAQPQFWHQGEVRVGRCVLLLLLLGTRAKRKGFNLGWPFLLWCVWFATTTTTEFQKWKPYRRGFGSVKELLRLKVELLS